MNVMTKESNTSGESLLIRGARIVTPERIIEGTALLIERGRIARLLFEDEAGKTGLHRALELDGCTLYPGFIDLHIHGALGVDVNETDAHGLRRVARHLATRGVTAWLPTLVPAERRDYERAASAVAQLMREDESEEEPFARPLGLHYEGPFVSHERCGALRRRFFLTYRESADLDALATVEADGARHMTTLAPEIEGGIELIAELVRRGFVVSIGHTSADIETLERARLAGARHMTHFMNAMSPLHHRAPGPVAWGLLRDDVSVDVIADGVHCHPLALELILRCKTDERVALISDAVAPAGLGDGEFEVWGERISVSDGRTLNERGSIAGSVIMMDDAVRMMISLGVSPEGIARMASTNPARLLELDGERGSIEEGKRADLVALDREGRVRLTVIDGRVAHDASGER